MKGRDDLNVLITGGTGFIGNRFVQKLAEEKCHAYVLTRYPKQYKDTEYISYISYQYPLQRLPMIHAVVNLAGESLFGYWTQEKKEKILSSRLSITERLIQVMMQMDPKPKVFISGSAIGYYGTSDEKIFTERTTIPGNDFLASVTVKWENAAQTAEDLGIRTVYTRFGVVLDRHNGALPMMALPIKFFLGGKIGSGKQWVSWIHIDDCIELLWHIIQNDSVNGPINMTAPNPLTNNTFTKTLAKTLSRPNLVKAPAQFVTVVLGEMHQLITRGQYVYPKKALENDYKFKFAHLKDALANIYNKS
mgnify:CR=1 FL=1